MRGDIRVDHDGDEEEDGSNNACGDDTALNHSGDRCCGRLYMGCVRWEKELVEW